MLKAAIKHSSGEDQVRHRIVPAETIQQWVEKLDNLKSEIAEIMVEEKEEKHVCSRPFLVHLTLPQVLTTLINSIAEESRDGTEEGPEYD